MTENDSGIDSLLQDIDTMLKDRINEHFIVDQSRADCQKLHEVFAMMMHSEMIDSGSVQSEESPSHDDAYNEDDDDPRMAMYNMTMRALNKTAVWWEIHYATIAGTLSGRITYSVQALSTFVSTVGISLGVSGNYPEGIVGEDGRLL